MKRFLNKILLTLAILALLWISLGLGHFFNNDFSKITVSEVSLESNEVPVSGWLYTPTSNSNSTLPAVALMHGVMNAKEVMSGIALELARNGIVALTIDATDHGSSGREKTEQEDGTKGGLAAVNFLMGLSYVNPNYIGVVGHSMGVGAFLSVSYELNYIKSHVFIGSSLNVTSINTQYGEMNLTTPKNMLVAVGKYDELINLNTLKEYLQPVFGTAELIEPDVLYGSFTNDTARKLITPPAIHLTEPNNRQIIQETIWWMKQSFLVDTEPKQIISPVRDFFLLIGFVSFFAIILLLSEFTSNLSLFHNKREIGSNTEYPFWKTGLLWGFSHLILFVPPILLFGFGSFLIPLVLGATGIFWLLLLSIAGLSLIIIKTKMQNREERISNQLRDFFRNFTDWKGMLFGFSLFLFMLFFTFLLELMPGVSLKLIVPLFSNFTSLRFLIFLIIVPFALPYTVIDNLIITRIYKTKRELTQSNKFLTGIQIYLIKMLPFLLTLILQYVPLLIFNFKLLGGFIGFSMQFIIMLIPLFGIYTTYTILFKNNSISE